MIKAQPFSVDDFSGGFCDTYLAGAGNKCQKNDNFVITPNKKLLTRPGSVVYDTAANAYQIPGGAVRIGHIINHGFDDVYLTRYEEDVNYLATTYQTLTGPGGFDVFPAAMSTTNTIAHSQWKKHTFISNELQKRPVKIYRNSDDVLKVGPAYIDNFVEVTNLDGLSTLPADLKTLVNELRTDFLAHYADTANHTTAADTVSAALITSGALGGGATLTDAITLLVQLQAAYNSHKADAVLSTGSRLYHSNLMGPYPGVPNLSLSNSSAPTDTLGAVLLANELKKLYNFHNNSIWGHPSTVANEVTSANAADSSVEPTLAEDWETISDLLNEIKRQYNAHIDDFQTHDPLTSFAALEHGVSAVDTGADTLTISSPTAYSDVGAKFVVDQKVYFLGSLPSPLVAGTLYFVKTVTTNNVITLASTLGGATINLTTSGGTFTCFATRDYLNYVTTTDASNTEDSAQLLAFTLSAAYYAHNEDLMFNATSTTSGTTTHSSQTVIGNFYNSAVALDMFLQPNGGGNNSYYKGTYVTTLQPSIYAISVNRNHISDGTDPDTENYRFSFRRFHTANTAAGNISDTNKLLYRMTSPFAYDAAYLDKTILIDLVEELRTKYNVHDASTETAHGIQSAHLVSESAGFASLDSFSFLYKFLYKYEYTNVDDVTFIERGRPLSLNIVTSSAVEDNAIAITNIPALGAGDANDPTHHDTANISIEIYRTATNGKIFYKVGSVANGTTTFTDSVSDDDLLNKELLYTEGGIVENEAPPWAKYLHIVESTGYYGNGIIDGITYPNRVWQSVPGIPGSVPGDFYVDLDTDVSWISSAKSRPLVATTRSVYRLDGSFDAYGRGAITHERISDTGSLCPQSVVQAEDGVFYFAEDGIYFTDGYKALRINDDWRETYDLFTGDTTRRKNIQGTYDPIQRLVYWTVQRADASGDNDTILVLDLGWGIRPESTFTTWSNGSYFRPTSLAIFNRQLLRADTRGYVFKHDDAYTDDPRIVTSTAPTNWGTVAITYDYISIAADFGNPKVRKFVPSMELFVKTATDASIQIKSINDDQGTGYAKSMKPIRYRDQYTGVIREERMFPAGGLRCSYKQVQFTNATVIITNSDTLGAASVNRAAKTVTLDSAVTYDWPDDALDWYIYFEKKNILSNNSADNVADAYTIGYQVTVRAADTLTVTDTTPSLPQGSVKWVLKGVPKDEIVEIQAFNMNGFLMNEGDTQNAYQGSQTGANA